MEQVDPRWRKASYSGNGGADCVEAGNVPSDVLIRDTKNRDGFVLSVPANAWVTFLATVKLSRRGRPRLARPGLPAQVPRLAP
jgi:hypothetical protein